MIHLLSINSISQLSARLAAGSAAVGALGDNLTTVIVIFIVSIFQFRDAVSDRDVGVILNVLVGVVCNIVATDD